MVFALYPYERGKYLVEEEDFFMGLVVHCAEAKLVTGGTFLERACKAIEADLCEQKQKMRKLYNPHRNLYLDKCYGEGKQPLVEWMDFSKYEEQQNGRLIGWPAVNLCQGECFGGTKSLGLGIGIPSAEMRRC